MTSAAMIHFGLDPGKFVPYLLGEYTSQYWDVCCNLDAVQNHVHQMTTIISNEYCWMDALLNCLLRNLRATS
jgi:hypothetical protein